MGRPRWITAKAFLLDERNGFVHEFALDPTCTVSYQDAYAAGAFAAVGAPVPLGRYFAQTVRANGLAVTVVGHSRPEVDQIEFLRHLLGRLQERFEDRVMDRLELARNEEARVEAERRRLAAESAAVQLRARGVARLQEALAAGAARLAAETSALASREAALAAREREVGAISPKTPHLDAREEEIRRQAEALLSVQAALRTREKELETLAARLLEQEQELQAREGEADRFFEELAAKVAKNARWERDLAKKAEALAAREEQSRGPVDEDRGEKAPIKARR